MRRRVIFGDALTAARRQQVHQTKTRVRVRERHEVHYEVSLNRDEVLDLIRDYVQKLPGWPKHSTPVHSGDPSDLPESFTFKATEYHEKDDDDGPDL